MADISKITIESGTYNIKDTVARNRLNIAENSLNLITNKKIICIGDSYAEGYVSSSLPLVESWADKIKNKWTNTIIKRLGGTGFVNVVSNQTFVTLLNQVTADNDVTDIIVCGGYNDINYSKQQIANAIRSFKQIVDSKFPNAKVHIGFIARTTNVSDYLNINKACNAYIDTSSELGFHYLHNVQYTLHDYFNQFTQNDIHPNQAGQILLYNNILEAFLYGSCTVNYDYTTIGITPNTDIFSSVDLPAFGCTMNNNQIEVSFQSLTTTLAPKTDAVNVSGRSTRIKIGDISSGYILGNTYGLTKIESSCIIRANGNNFYNVPCAFEFTNGSLYLIIFGTINDGHNNYNTFTNVTQIQIFGFTKTLNAMMN